MRVRSTDNSMIASLAAFYKWGGSFRVKSWPSCPAAALCNVPLDPAAALQISKAVERQ